MDLLPLTDDAAEVKLSAGIALPGYEDTSDRKVLGAVKQMFKDFNYDATDDVSQQFKDVDAIAEYVQSSIDEINQAKQIGDRMEVGRNAAVLARFWYMAERLNSALSCGKYGQGVGNQLAKLTGFALSTIYSIRAVAVKLTPSDCWLLGTRGCTPTHLRKLAAVTDDSTREGIIKAFLKAMPDTSDAEAGNKARKALTTACNSNSKSDFMAEATSDPMNGGTEIEVSEEYTNGVNNLKLLSRMTKTLADQDKFVDIRDSLGQIYVNERTPNAQDKVNTVIELAQRVKDNIAYVEAHFKELLPELDSIIEALTVTDDQGNPVQQ